MKKEDNFIKKIHAKYLEQNKNLEVPHKKLLICFSGIAGSGKTYISKILEKKYSAVRIRNDSLRDIIRNLDKKLKEEYVDIFVDKYLQWFLTNHILQNQLIIFDSGIDRRYKQIFSLAKKKKYKIFIIRIKSSRKILEKRIFEKDNCQDEHFNSEIERWTQEYIDFGKNVKSDIIIKNEDDLDLQPLFNELDKLIKY